MVFLASSKNKQVDASPMGKCRVRLLTSRLCILLESVFSECLQMIGLHVQVAARGSLGRFSITLSRYNQRLFLNQEIQILTESPLKQSCNACCGLTERLVLSLEIQTSNNL